MKKPVQVYITSVLKACQSLVDGGSITPKTAKTNVALDLVGPPLLTRTRTTTAVTEMSKMSPPSSSYGNPCLDLYFQVKLEDDYSKKPTPQDSLEYLKKLLPDAWSHNPLTTLKLIFNLLPLDGKYSSEGFYTAAYWLYQNHPKTLATNIPQVASLGSISSPLEILYRALKGEHVRRTNKKFTRFLPVYKEWSMGIGGRISSSKRRDKIISLANNAVQRYHLHPNYRILHDAISDFFAHCLDMDISNLNNYHNHESSKCLEITSTADACPYIDSSYDRATLLCESIAKKLFPRKSGEEEVDYACRVRKKLRNKVLVPLRKVLDSHYSRGSNRWGYTLEFKKEPSKAQSYLEELKAGKCQIKADALLPSEIFACLTRCNNVDGAMDDVVELQWKAMVDMYLKQGKFKNCLAAFDVTPYEEITVGLGILVSQLNEEACWKGKAITFSENPKLVSIQGDDLKSKYEFMSDVEDAYYREIDLEKVFDLILGVGVNENLKPEQMIKKMFVFTRWGDCNSNKNRLTSSDYEAIECRFKEKGYVVPQILFWEVYDHKSRRAAGPAGWTQPGMKLFSGTGDNLVKLFLENDGDIVPHHVMEAALAGQEYQSLLLVD